jgi:hypothetical protein
VRMFETPTPTPTPAVSARAWSSGAES